MTPESHEPLKMTEQDVKSVNNLLTLLYKISEKKEIGVTV